MMPPADALAELLERVDAAAADLRDSPSVPSSVAELVDGLESTLHAGAPQQLDVDPYLTTVLFAGAYRAEKALRHDDSDHRRRDLRIALEQIRHALGDIVSNRPFGADTPVREVLANTVEAVSVPQSELARLLGVSTRQLQRWLAPAGSAPTGDDEARVRIVAQLVNQLRYSFTAPGVMSWFLRDHPALHVAPISELGDPSRYRELLAAATASRSMAG